MPSSVPSQGKPSESPTRQPARLQCGSPDCGNPEAQGGPERRSNQDGVEETARTARFDLRAIVPLAVVVTLGLLFFAMGWHRALSLEHLLRHRVAIDAFATEHRLAAVAAYMAIYILAVSLSVPGTFVLTIIGGILFGVVIGGLAAVAAATLGAIVIFVVAKSACGALLLRRAGSRLAKVAAGFRANAFNYLLFLRLVPVFPFWLVNLAAALFGVSLTQFATATAVGILPGAFAYAFVGAGLDSALMAEVRAYQTCVAAEAADCRLRFDPMMALTPQLVAALAALGGLALLPILVRRLRARRQAAASSR